MSAASRRMAASVVTILCLVSAFVAAQDFEQQTVTSASGAVVGRYPMIGPGAEPVDDFDAPPIQTRSDGWTQLPCGPNLFLRQIAMVTPQVGYIAGELGIVLKTTDGGESWQPVVSMGFPYYWYGCAAFDDNSVFVSGFQNQTGEGIGRWSYDGGATWGPTLTLAPSPNWLAMAKFIDRDHGLLSSVAYGAVVRTATGGATAGDWTAAWPTENWFDGPFTYLPDGRAWVGGYDMVYTEDHGQNWTLLPKADPACDGSIGMLENGHGFTGSGDIFWTVAGWIYRTEDSGNTWGPRLITLPYPIRAVLTLDENHAWAVGGNYYSSPHVGGIWVTDNGGETWSLEQDTANELIDIEYVRVDARHIDVYAVGNVSQIWRLHYTLPGLPGDMNCDGVVNNADIPDFVLALTDPDGYAAAYPECDITLGDIDGDGDFNNADIPAFVELLTGG